MSARPESDDDDGLEAEQGQRLEWTKDGHKYFGENASVLLLFSLQVWLTLCDSLRQTQENEHQHHTSKDGEKPEVLRQPRP